MYFRYLTVFCFLLSYISGRAQPPQDSDTKGQQVTRDSLRQADQLYDIVDLVQTINPFKKEGQEKNSKTNSPSTYLPNLNYNPSIGAQIGVKAVRLHLVKNQIPRCPSGAAALSATTRGIIFGYVSHDIYTPGNRWNIKGAAMVARAVGLDYGLGIGGTLNDPTEEELILNNPDRTRYVNRFMTYSINERIYKQLFPGAFVGLGVFFEPQRKLVTQGSEPK